MNLNQLKQDIITPTLSILQAYSDDAMELLIFTCAVESNGGEYVKQINGPALGIYQMEPATHSDIWSNYIRRNVRLQQIIGLNFNCPTVPNTDRLVYDLRYATMMARLNYMRFPEALPDRNDHEALFEYYKKYYNTEFGKATKAESIKKYKAFIKA